MARKDQKNIYFTLSFLQKEKQPVVQEPVDSSMSI